MNQAQIELVSVKAPADSSELIGAVASIGLIPATIDAKFELEIL